MIGYLEVVILYERPSFVHSTNSSSAILTATVS